jgi:hypothetical protein
MARARLAEGPREHRGKCGGRARQPRGQLTGCLWELPPSFSCRGSHAPPRSGACRLTARHGGANSAQGTQGAPLKMQRQGAATPGSTHRVSVECPPILRLPRQPHTAPLERKLFAAAALFRVQEKHQIEHVWVSFHMFWGLLFSWTKTAKLQNPCIFWTWRFCVHFVPRFDTSDSLPDPETQRVFALRP